MYADWHSLNPRTKILSPIEGITCSFSSLWNLARRVSDMERRCTGGPRWAGDAAGDAGMGGERGPALLPDAARTSSAARASAALSSSSPPCAASALPCHAIFCNYSGSGSAPGLYNGLPITLKLRVCPVVQQVLEVTGMLRMMMGRIVMRQTQ